MGGSALKIHVDRLNLDAYNQVCQRIISILNEHQCYETVFIPRQAPGKISFGDVDLIVAGKKQLFNIKDVFKSTVCVKNGSVTSFDYLYHDGRRFQIDLIEVDLSQVEFARFCYSDGDLGMLIGMMLGRLKLKWGYQGLTLLINNGTNKIQLTKHNLCLALSFLGMSYESWVKGFETESDLFAFITTCRFFCRSMFHKDISTFNHGDRVAFRNRPMVERFFDYVTKLNTNDISSEFVECSTVRNEAIAFFSKQSEVDKLELESIRRRQLHERFNGHIVMSITDLKGKQLAEFLTHCRSLLKDEDILEMTINETHNSITQLWKEYSLQSEVSDHCSSVEL